MEVLSSAFSAVQAMCSQPQGTEMFSLFDCVLLHDSDTLLEGILLNLYEINTDILRFAESHTYFSAESDKRK
jgi:hypothetical protein